MRRTQGEDGHHKRRRNFRRKQPCQHLDLGLPASGTEPLMEGPVLGGCAKMGRWTKPVPRVSILRHGRKLAGTLLQGGRRLVPSPPGETTAPPPWLSSTPPSPEKFHFNHSTLVQYSILRLRKASDKTRFPFKQTRKLNPSWK